MKKTIRYLIRQILLMIIPILGVYRFYRKKNKNKVLVLVYHDVVDSMSDCKTNHYNYNTTIDKKRFAKQVRYICRHYNPITLKEFIAWKTSCKKLPDNSVLFTFDDGHTNLYRNALPVLDRHGIKGVFFCKSACMGEVAMNYCEDYLSYIYSIEECKKQYNLFRNSTFDRQIDMINSFKGKPRYDSPNKSKYEHFTIQECLSMLQNGHSIQSHTIHHYILSSLNDADAETEIRQSREDLARILQHEVNCIAYPFGDLEYDFGLREKAMAKSHGYILGFSGERCNNNGVDKQEDNFSISRFGDVNHDFLYFKLLLSPVRLVK